MTKPLPTRKMQLRHLERLRTPALIDRMQAHALGDLLARPELVRKIVRAVVEDLAKDGSPEFASLPTARVEQIGRAVSALLNRAGMDMSQVRAAEVLLKKALPDLANVEFRGEVQRSHTVLLPQGMSPDEWLRNAQATPALEHEPASRPN